MVEFFNGNPELLNSNRDVDALNSQIFPYDQSYEVDLDELDIS
jgi:hypothetical protein